MLVTARHRTTRPSQSTRCAGLERTSKKCDESCGDSWQCDIDVKGVGRPASRRGGKIRFKSRGMCRRGDVEESKSDADAETPIRCVSLRDDRRPVAGYW